MMRRATVLLLVMLAATVMASGLALAATKRCKPDVNCNGTMEGDKLLGSAGTDDIFGMRGDDRLLGNEESDELYGGKGRDKLFGGPNNPVGFADQLDGGPGNDALNGGEGDNDIYYYFSNSWGKDTITETAVSDTDPNTGNKINLQPSVTTTVTINLVSDSGPVPEMKNGDGSSTVNWSGNVIDRVESYSNGDDTINGNPAANHIRSQNGVSVVSSGGGSDVVSVADFAPGDTVDWGGTVINPDNDTVIFDAGDVINNNCEIKNP
jgi:Ca2+-binding RTX toxin-like protein